MQARFWAWTNGPTRIKINVNQTLSWYSRKPTDEGWHSDFEEWFFDGKYVYRQYQSDGRDCDGRHTKGGKSRFHYRDYLKGRVIGYQEMDAQNITKMICFPKWEHLEYDPVYDEYAQAAGY